MRNRGAWEALARKMAWAWAAFAPTVEPNESLASTVELFPLLRNMMADGFFTSKIGIKYLGYKGNTFLTHFDGCPAVQGV